MFIWLGKLVVGRLGTSRGQLRKSGYVGGGSGAVVPATFVFVCALLEPWYVVFVDPLLVLLSSRCFNEPSLDSGFPQSHSTPRHTLGR